MTISWKFAPDGATHQHKTTNEKGAVWEKWENGSVYYLANGVWKFYKLQRHCAEWERIPIPKPQSQEWDGEGLPPVGCECEVLGTKSGAWCIGVIDYIDSLRCVWHWKSQPKQTMHNVIGQMKFRPNRTQAELEREELAEIIQSECENHFPSPTRWSEVADAIISAGWKKERT